jgi:tetratricopeptide (TPR) repeat protein
MICVPVCLRAETGTYFNFSPAARDAYQKTLSLRFDEARVVLAEIKRTDSANLIPYFIENYLDFLTIYLHDQKQEYKRLSGNMDRRLEQMAGGDPSSPYCLYTQAEIRLQWAVLRLRYTDYLSGISDVKQAYALLEENQRKFPWFVPNKKSLGILHALVGNIPDEYKWLVRTLGGMSGTTQQGLKEVEEVLAYARGNDLIFEDETVFVYSYLELYLNNSGDLAWNALKNSKLNPKTNPLAAFAMAGVAMRAGYNDEAIRLLQEAPSGTRYYPAYPSHFQLGLAKLRRLDEDAHTYLESFLNKYEGENGVKDGYQKLAWYHLIRYNDAGYRTYMNFVMLKGVDANEPDKVAQREAKSREMPDALLLQARLLFDGGYFQRALQMLKDAGGNYAGQPKAQLEYAYRMGRILHKLGKNQEAIRYYQQTVDQGSGQPWYFACSAAFNLGLIYEGMRDYKNARAAFGKCIDIKPEEYAGSLHAQAKAGLSRVKSEK